MSDCGNYNGNQVVVGFDDVLANSADPTTGTYKPFGHTNSKSFSATTTTVDVTKDSTGSVNATNATGLSAEVTVSGFAADEDITGNANQGFLRNLYFSRLAAGEQPKLWLEITTPLESIYMWSMMNGVTLSPGASKEAATYEFSFSATDTCSPGNEAIQYSYTPAVP